MDGKYIMLEERIAKFFNSLYEKALRRFSMLALTVIIVVALYAYVLLLVAWPWEMPRGLIIVNYLIFSVVITASIVCGIVAHGQRNEIREIATAIRNNGTSHRDVIIPPYRCNDLDVLVEEIKQLLAANKELRIPLDEIRQKCSTQSDFLRGLAEQLVAPTHLILNNIELSLTGKNLPATTQDKLEEVHAKAAELVRLTGSMLTIANLDRGNQLEFGQKSIVSCAERAYEIMRPPLHFMKIWLDVHDIARDKQLYCDYSLIIQLMVALISHGADGIKGGGKVEMTIRDYKMDIGKERYDAILIEVSDSGKPIVLDSVFSVFEAVDQEALKKSPYRAAHKADLTLAANITELHYGRIWAVPRSDGFIIRVAIPRDFREVLKYIDNDNQQGGLKNAA
ncbi:MAG: HAMP domain-containing histidine kinase [Proteobacteria bacterium]|nr:HAMP domain-containing histidine kinase [Pseudomonadota bacterium]